MSARTEARAVSQEGRARVGLEVGKALGELDGIARYARGLLSGLVEVEAERAPERRFEYVLYPLFRCERVLAVDELVGDVEGFTLAERSTPRGGEVDLFHATAWAVPAGFHGPLALTLYDLTFLTLAGAHTRENRGHCLIGLSRVLARGGALCAISNGVRDEAARRLGLAPDAIGVAPPAVDPTFTPREPVEIERVRHDLEIDRPYVLAVGTMEPRKNLSALIEAWSSMPAEVRAGYRLALAGGEGWDGTGAHESPRQAAQRLGVAKEIRWLGRVADELLPALYSGAAVFAYPSLAEGFGLPPLEAMACGAPVVASDRPALPETLGDAALLVDPESPESLAEALLEVLRSAERAASMRVAGRRRVERYSWRATAESVRDLWARRLAARGGATAEGGG